MSDNKQQRVVIWLIFLFLRIREEPTTKQPEENSLNLEEEIEENLCN